MKRMFLSINISLLVFFPWHIFYLFYFSKLKHIMDVECFSMFLKEENLLGQQSTTNSNAIISLIFGVLSLIIPFVGFIFGIIGIVTSLKAKKQMKETLQDGDGLATAGLVCSIAGLALQVLAIIGFIAFSALIFSDISNHS